jgi:hypothetical protein
MKKIDLTKLVDVFAGAVKLDKVVDEIKRYMLKSPEKMIITIERDEKAKRYHTTIYLTKEDFYKR